jgi:hypothetical protein
MLQATQPKRRQADLPQPAQPAAKRVAVQASSGPSDVGQAQQVAERDLARQFERDGPQHGVLTQEHEQQGLGQPSSEQRQMGEVDEEYELSVSEHESEPQVDVIEEEYGVEHF